MRRADAPRMHNFDGPRIGKVIKPAKSPYAIESYEASARTDLTTHLARTKPPKPAFRQFR